MLTITLLALCVSIAVAHTATAARPSISVRIADQIVGTWRCEDQRGIPRTPARTSPWKLGNHSAGFKTWLLNRWVLRRKACLTVLHAHDATIRRLQRGLSGTPMDGTAGPLEAAGRRYGISPYFIAAIAGTESSFGAAACRGNPYNAFGLSSCTSGWHVPYFPTWASAYQFMGAFLSSRWPSARTTMDYHGYAACSSCWGRKTAQHMANRFGVGPSVRYGA